MAWARIDDRANGNGKIMALSDAAFRLWACGLIYCQANLTNGFIPEHATRTFGVRARSIGAITLELTKPLVPGKGPLWHPVQDGYQVHDYLDWNDSRDEVLEQRARAKDRLERFRNRVAQRETERSLQRVTEHGTNEGSTSTSTSTSTEDPKSDSAAPNGAPPSDAVLTFPTVGESSSWTLTERHISELAESFPDVDVLAECRHAHAWVRASTQRRKTPKGMPRFLVGWMGRSNDSGRAQRPAAPVGRPVAETFTQQRERMEREKKAAG